MLIPRASYTTFTVSPNSIFSKSLYLSFSVVDAKSIKDKDVSNLIVPILFFLMYFSAFARSWSSVGTESLSEDAVLVVEFESVVVEAFTLISLVSSSSSSLSALSPNSDDKSSIRIRLCFIAFASGVSNQIILSFNSTCVTLVFSSELEELLLGITSE